MRTRTIFVCMLMAALGLLFAAPCFSQEIPKPGTTIDKSNYKKYMHLLPAEWAGAFENGFGGLTPVYKMNVVETKHYPMPKLILDHSTKNKGKYSLGANGRITPAYDRQGLPFPDLQRSDKDFLIKLMWNYDSRYYGDDAYDLDGHSFEKRRGEPVRDNKGNMMFVCFANRLVEAPKPVLPNPVGLYKVTLFRYTAPESVRNTMTLSYRYIDSDKPDDTYLYLPSMRRVLRAEATQRSTPITGSTQALDDLSIFEGRIPDFKYTLVGEQKVLAVIDSKMSSKVLKQWNNPNLFPVEFDNYEVRDVYVIDIVPKNPRYPQSKKRIWVDKETLWPFYGVAYDRAGKLWKVWQQNTKVHAVPGGGGTPFTCTILGIDLQFGLAGQYISDYRYNASHKTYNDVTPQALLKLGQ